MERALRLLEIIYASAVAREIQNLRQEVCCGCKIYAQDCLMMTEEEEEEWDMHGLVAMECVNYSPSVWHEFSSMLFDRIRPPFERWQLGKIPPKLSPFELKITF